MFLLDLLRRRWSGADTAGGEPRFIAVVGCGHLGDVLQLSPLLAALRERFAPRPLLLAHSSRLAPELLGRLADRHLHFQAGHEASVVQRLLRHGACDLVARWRYAVTYHPTRHGRLAPDESAFVHGLCPRQRRWERWLARFPLDNDGLWRAATGQGMNMYRLAAHTAGFDGCDFEAFRTPAPDHDPRARWGLPARFIAVCNSAHRDDLVRSPVTKLLPQATANAVTRRLAGLGWPLVHLGTDADEPALEGVAFDLRGRTSVPEAAAILGAASAFVAPEGGLANLARAVDGRGVVFFGSTPPEFFGFRANVNIAPTTCGGCWWTTPSYVSQCPRLDAQPACVGSISADRIVDAVLAKAAA